jgi:hypothetical protein
MPASSPAVLSEIPNRQAGLPASTMVIAATARLYQEGSEIGLGKKLGKPLRGSRAFFAGTGEGNNASPKTTRTPAKREPKS